MALQCRVQHLLWRATQCITTCADKSICRPLVSCLEIRRASKLSRELMPCSIQHEGRLGSGDIRCFSSQVAHAEHACESSFAVEVGSRVVVDLAKDAPGLSVGVSPDPEAVTAKWGPVRDALKSKQEDNVTNFIFDEKVRSIVKMWVPERFCSVDVKAGIGAVSVENINQGDLRIETAGGAVDVGKIKSEHINIDSGGGAVKAKLLSGAIEVQTQGGPLKLGQVIGNRVALSSKGGDCTIRSFYADSFYLLSGGGDIYIETLGNFDRRSSRPVGEALDPEYVRSRVRVEAGAGNIRFDKLDGGAFLQSSGGNVTVQLTERTQLLALDMDGGELELSVPEALLAQTRPFDQAFRSWEDEKIIISSSSVDLRVALQALTKDWRCQVVLLGTGTPERIVIRRGRGWMDALRERFGSMDRT